MVSLLCETAPLNAAWQHAENPAAANEHHVTYARRFGHMGLQPENFGLRFNGGIGSAVLP